MKRAGIAQDQIGAIKEDGVALSLSLTPEQIALLTSPRKHNTVGEPEYIKVCKKVNITWSPKQFCQYFVMSLHERITYEEGVCKVGFKLC